MPLLSIPTFPSNTTHPSLSLDLSLSRTLTFQGSQFLHHLCFRFTNLKTYKLNCTDEMKKIVLKLELHDDKAKQRALKTVSTLSGIESIAVDMKEREITVIGTVDPIKVVRKLRKHWPSTTIVLVGPAKEPEKENKEEPKKEEGEKKDEELKRGEEKVVEGPKKEEEVKKEGEEPKKEDDTNSKEEDLEEYEEKIKPIDPYVLEVVKANYMAYHNNTHLNTYYYGQSMEENPNICAIC